MSPTPRILAIDPGPVQSAVVEWDGQKIHSAEILENAKVCTLLAAPFCAEDCFIEMVASYGMPVGREVFETCVWIGRFYESWLANTFKHPSLIYRRDIKLHHCHDSRAKDSNIHQALIDKYGDKGTKKAPGVTYGLKKDLWAAFALATFITEREAEIKPLEQANV